MTTFTQEYVERCKQYIIKHKIPAQHAGYYFFQSIIGNPGSYSRSRLQQEESLTDFTGYEAKDIVWMAHNHYNDSLLEGESFNIGDCNCCCADYGDDHGDCRWTFGQKRCRCDNRRVSWFTDEDEILSKLTLDSEYPVGHWEFY